MDGDDNTIDLFAQFLQWEKASKDTIDFKKIYVDMADDLVAGLVLSQIVFWHLPNKSGVTKLTVSKDGEPWIAKARKDWWNEVRVRPRELDRALKILKAKQLVFSDVFLYKNTRTLHVRLNRDLFIKQFQSLVASPSRPLPTKSRIGNLSKNGNRPNHESVTPCNESVISYIKESETTSETTLNTVASSPLPPPPADIPIPIPAQSVAPVPRQPSVKLPPPSKAKALVPSKNGNGTKPSTSAAAKTAQVKKERAESPESVLFRAIDHEFFFDAGYTNSTVWGILNGRTKQGIAGIIFDECERQKTTRDKLDYRALAAMVPKFRAWYDQQNGKKLNLRNPENFCNWWNGWRNTTNRVDCPPRLFYDEHCPNRCDHGRVYTFDDKGMVVDATDCICVIRIRDERKGIKY